MVIQGSIWAGSYLYGLYSITAIIILIIMTGAIMGPVAPILHIIAGIAVMTAVTQTDTIRIEKVSAEEMAPKEETTTKETKATATMTSMTGRILAPGTAIEGMGTTTAIMISAPTTKNVPIC